jgi:hypothetical protein
MVRQQRWGGGCLVGGHHPGAKKGTIMEILVVAIVAVVAFGLYRFMRTRTAH